MKVVPHLDQSVARTEIAQILGLSDARVSQLASEGLFPRGETAHEWLLGYCERLRDNAAGRATGDEEGALNLAQERAALAREQRIAQALKNDVARGEYAPIGLLTDVLSKASRSVVDGFDQLDGLLRKACPDLQEEARAAVLSVIAKARNEWIKSTASLVATSVEEAMAEADEPEDADE